MDANTGFPLIVSTISGAIGYLATLWLIPRVSQQFVKIGLFGKDLSKRDKPIIPETIGAIPATIFILMMFCDIPILFYKDLLSIKEPAVVHFFPHRKLCEFLSAVLCLESILLLGIADDLFDLRWRHKFFLPAFAAIPLLVVYYVDFGVTTVTIPPFIYKIFSTFKPTTSAMITPFPQFIDLKWGYYAYMGCVSIFCPNSINILAGVNGLEVGQTIVLCIIFLINDGLFLINGINEASKHSHMMSAVLIIQLLGVSLALYHYNKFPAKVFVGDTFCYFAGMVFACCGILGHFSKTTLLFFLPQIFNFIYSVPQLFGLVPCPRHRMPKFNENDGLLYPSRANLLINEKGEAIRIKPIAKVMLKLLYLLRLIDLEFDEKNGEVKSCTNMTLINLILVWSGPLREDKLCQRILLIQFIIGLLAIVTRHVIGAFIFKHDNLWTII
ncbi:related to UDP-N-acetylglucosamine--dolichyl-phosphate N-acetylglucosaminephosphotransferase [Saccharomycodes ludwigii]|uniref:UDP-N-acetylglucosamine--dolichyl-phosphate N-acetylglucosaminephosphotransferase n=1 Tax=Saccharomycodes ludwigii TaxID=36035 RepID=A0A376B634_9ASCO|nr:hypothetical protein SCDLUD_001035 [Saccharomycodes ludwigii]KAH3903400.1 hypothetical protein SCDLUD_001035 [Saccharomycodes ludwigii]SSD60019.1 related to UDP-N-acetylglucosamine--dolichyl-phosphate N-acetylglucosaminephosphotransferase [Saccharomycodes ludwigii]